MSQIDLRGPKTRNAKLKRDKSISRQMCTAIDVQRGSSHDGIVLGVGKEDRLASRARWLAGLCSKGSILQQAFLECLRNGRQLL